MTQKNTEVSRDRDRKSGQVRGSGRTEKGVRKSFPKEVTLIQSQKTSRSLLDWAGEKPDRSGECRSTGSSPEGPGAVWMWWAMVVGYTDADGRG